MLKFVFWITAIIYLQTVLPAPAIIWLSSAPVSIAEKAPITPQPNTLLEFEQSSSSIWPTSKSQTGHIIEAACDFFFCICLLLRSSIHIFWTYVSFPLEPNQFNLTWLSITTEYYLNIRGVIIAKSCGIIYTQHKHIKTKENVESMVYLLLGVWIFVRLRDHGVGFCAAISLF